MSCNQCEIYKMDFNFCPHCGEPLTENERLRRERDAAVKMLSHYCDTCANNIGCDIMEDTREFEMHTSAIGECDNWQWRGLEE